MPTEGFVPTSERPVRSGPSPTVSVVALWTSGDADSLAGCLAPILQEVEEIDAEIVVVASGTAEAPAPGVPAGARVVVVAEGTPIADWRAAGMGAARGDVVGFLDDTERPEPGWARRLTGGR